MKVTSCSKEILHKSSKCIYPGTTIPVRYQSQTGHDPHGYNPVELSTPLPLGAISVAVKQAINRALNATRGTSVAIKQAINRFTLNTEQ